MVLFQQQQSQMPSNVVQAALKLATSQRAEVQQKLDEIASLQKQYAGSLQKCSALEEQFNQFKA